MGNPKYFGYPREIQIIIGFPTQNAKLEKLITVHFVPTYSILVQKVNCRSRIPTDYFIFHWSQGKNNQKPKPPSEDKKSQHEHNNPTCSVPSYWSTDPEEVSTGYCYFQAVVEEQVWSHPGCLLCSLGSLGGGTTTDAKQSSTEASPLESHAAMNICR